MYEKSPTEEGKIFLGTYGVARDISDRKRLETQLQHAQRMEALGALGGGIAHDFNNLLMAIQGNTSLMLLDMDATNSHYERLRNIEASIQSGAELTKQLLAFAKGGKYEVIPTNINNLIRKSSEMFERTKKEINISRKYQQDIWTLEVDQGQLEQAFLNLYLNAWQAMPGGGNLHIETENVLLDEAAVKPFQVTPGKYVKISFSDSGIGMDELTLERIFEPFFTTKTMGRGTGLGLASVYGTINNHGGFIDVYSKQGKGTTFHLYLPASDKEIIEAKPSSPQILKGSDTLLLVDDEEVVLNVGKDLLENLGYTVLVAESGQKALEVYKANRDNIDLVILDMIMPDMSGSETYDALKSFDPEMKSLLSSGYSLDGQANDILQRGCNGFIQKPFNIRELSHKLRQVLEN
jgi:nitrogen-specific signal transduction histidine kinase